MQLGDEYLSNMKSLSRFINGNSLHSTLDFGMWLGQRILIIAYESETFNYSQLSINKIILYQILKFEISLGQLICGYHFLSSCYASHWSFILHILYRF
jgi:hypothetical protein